MLGQVGDHLFCHTLVYWCGSRVIQVNRGMNAHVNPRVLNLLLKLYTAIAVNLFSRNSSLSSTCKNDAICSALLLLPRLTRTAPRARYSSMLMASSTWLGSVLSLEQAEPLATAKPLRSSAMTRVSPSMSGK